MDQVNVSDEILTDDATTVTNAPIDLQPYFAEATLYGINCLHPTQDELPTTLHEAFNNIPSFGNWPRESIYLHKHLAAINARHLRNREKERRAEEAKEADAKAAREKKMERARRRAAKMAARRRRRAAIGTGATASDDVDVVEYGGVAGAPDPADPIGAADPAGATTPRKKKDILRKGWRKGRSGVEKVDKWWRQHVYTAVLRMHLLAAPGMPGP